MRGLRLIPVDINISFIPKRIIFFIFSAVLITSSVGLFLTKGLNYGIDFQGGILMEVRTDKAVDISAMRTTLANLGLGEVTLQEFGQPTDVLIRVQRQEGDESAQQAAVVVDDGGDAGVGAEDHGLLIGECSKAGDLEVLGGGGGVPKPTIVADGD